MRVLVVDDERPCLDELVYLLSKRQGINVVGAFTSPAEALEVLADLKPDAAFLDLSMPHMNGAELAERMLTLMPCLKIVFVTAYWKELQKLKDYSAVGSILKPVSEAKLLKVMQRLQTEKNERRNHNET